jgi:hypothetical protein
MPPQPGIFALPYGTTTHSQGGALASTSSQGHLHHNFHQHGGAVAGPSSRAHVTASMDDTRKDNRKRKDVSGKLGKEMGDRRDELSFFLSFLLVFLSFLALFVLYSSIIFFPTALRLSCLTFLII